MINEIISKRMEPILYLPSIAFIVFAIVAGVAAYYFRDKD
jgi:hypothetical protein